MVLPSRLSTVFFLCGLLTATASGGGVTRWKSGDGPWENAAKWGGTLPGLNAEDDIMGKSQVTINGTEVMASRLDVGENPGSDATLILNGGAVTAMEFIRLGEYPGSHGRFVLNGGRVCTTEVGIGGMNQGETLSNPCQGEMEIHGGSFITRYLMLGWRTGSTARLTIAGSKAERIVALNSMDCCIPTGKVGSQVALVFNLDAGGVTPITLWNKKDSIRLSRPDGAGQCVLSVGLLDAPPAGDIVLMTSAKPCSGTFHDLPEGSPVRATRGGTTYEWTLTYHGGGSHADVVLTHPQVVDAQGNKTAYLASTRQQVVKVDAAVIKTAWEDLYRQADSVAPPMAAGPLAFPGAEGFGAHAKGGRGGRVLRVSNLNDAGPGSLRAAIDTKGPRTVIFELGGTIELKRALQIREPFITIAGQTAPGDGICLKGATDTLSLIDTHDVIVRFLRVRTGHTGDKDANEGDCISCYDANNFIIDHCSTSWGTDETLSCTQTCDRYTVQWSIIAEGLDYYGHSMASLLGGDRSTWHHNLFAHCRTRNPRFVGLCRCDFRNNVIYDWGDTSGYGDFRAVNYANNYLRPGPSTTQKPPRFLRGDGVMLPGSLYLQGNVIQGSDEITRDNRSTLDDKEVFADQPWAMPAVITQPADQAQELVLSQAGALLPKRDAVDARLMEETRNGTGHVIKYETDLPSAWPVYASGPGPIDSLEDGIPDAWKLAHGLPLNDASIATRVNEEGYTNLEVYLNSLVAPAAPVKLAGTLAKPSSKPLVRVVLVGDSTVTDRTGWGIGLKEHLADNVVCANLAAGGRSSKSFRSEGRWEPALNLKPDYVLIQFGHNDEPGKGPELETDPATTFTANEARYVDEARKAGAKPVLVTSIARRAFDPHGKALPGKVMTRYVEAVRKLAHEQHVPLLELQTRTLELYNQLGKDGCEKQISPVLPGGGVDNTHVNLTGSRLIGALVAEELGKAVPELAEDLR